MYHTCEDQSISKFEMLTKQGSALTCLQIALPEIIYIRREITY